MEVDGTEEREEVMDVLETGALFRYGHENIRKGMWKALEFEEGYLEQYRNFCINKIMDFRGFLIAWLGYCTCDTPVPAGFMS